MIVEFGEGLGSRGLGDGYEDGERWMMEWRWDG